MRMRKGGRKGDIKLTMMYSLSSGRKSVNEPKSCLGSPWELVFAPLIVLLIVY